MSQSVAYPAYIIAARRSALGRVGGLHKSRRIEDLVAPILAVALEDAGIEAKRVDEIILGNASAGGNPARLIALAAGLPETTPAYTIDRQCASGLDAILAAIRGVAAGEAEIVVAGGAESLSTAPWRVAKPRSLYQLPRFLAVEPAGAEASDEPQQIEACEALAKRLGISRERQDAYAVMSHLRATEARNQRRFVGEIVPIKHTSEEARDQGSDVEPSFDELADLAPFLSPGGTLTRGNTAALHDGAAIAVVVSRRVYQQLGSPPALRLMAASAQGVAPGEEATAPLEAMRKMYAKLNGFDRSAIGIVELSESSAAQAIAFKEGLGLEEPTINPDGGAIVRGHPFGASGAVLVTRLFTRMARPRIKGGDAGKPAGAGGKSTTFGAVSMGAVGGLGLAALFEAV